MQLALTNYAGLVHSFHAGPYHHLKLYLELWQDLARLDYAASYNIDSMLAAFSSRSGTQHSPCNLGGLHPISLRVKALQETQKAIQDPDRCWGLGLIVAVAASIFEAVSHGPHYVHAKNALADSAKVHS